MARRILDRACLQKPRRLPAFALSRRFFENLYAYRPEALAGFSLSYAAPGTSSRISGKTTPILVPGWEQRNLAAQSEGVAGRWNTASCSGENALGTWNRCDQLTPLGIH